MKAFSSILKGNRTGNLSNISVLLIGNNPIELNQLYEQFSDMKERISNVYISFSEKEALKAITTKQPNCIIIDDNYGESSMKRLMHSLKKIKSSSFYCTLIKSSNRASSIFGFQDYILKDGISAERLYRSIINGIKFRQRINFTTK